MTMQEKGTNRSQTIPARIHVFVAREAPYAVILRRGPSKQVCTIGWDMKNDTFDLGQWLKGRIYEHYCDVSPDGAHFIYSATKGRQMPEVDWYWTAISRSPYLKAIGLWKMTLPVGGGGLFGERGDYSIVSFDCHESLREPSRLQRLREPPSGVRLPANTPGVYFERLIRDGWLLNECRETRLRYHKKGKVPIFDKPIGDFWILRKIIRSGDSGPGHGLNFDEHHLVDKSTEREIDVADWEWADYAHSRLLWSTGGALYTGRLTSEGVVDQRMLKDFNDMTFENRDAPY
ncbi:MAG TPA: hypothetical protein P5081_19435 [Phycisphaerae bacterium]|nr:hypothetical protein [Phycisphaerae bacterium]